MGLKGYKITELDANDIRNFSSKKNSAEKFESTRRKKTLSYFDEIRKISHQHQTSKNIDNCNANNSSEFKSFENNIYTDLYYNTRNTNPNTINTNNINLPTQNSNMNSISYSNHQSPYINSSYYSNTNLPNNNV